MGLLGADDRLRALGAARLRLLLGGGPPIVDGGPAAELSLTGIDLPDCCVRPLSRVMRSGFVMRGEFDL